MALPDWARSSAPDGRFASARGGVGRGLSLNLVAAVFQFLGAILSTIVLSRILLAEDFGVYGMIMPFISIILLIVDGGAIYYMLRSPQVVERETDMLFWYALTCGAVGTAALVLALPAIAWAMDEPRLIGAGAVASLALFFTALGSQHGALMMRCFRNDLRALAIIGGVIVGVTAGIALGVAGFGYWALIALLVLRVGVISLLNFGLSRWRPGPPRWDRALMSDIFRLIRPTLRGRIVLALVRESDKIIIGVLYSTTLAGFYVFAQMLSVVPLQQILAPSVSVVMPWLAEFKSDQKQVFTRSWDLLCIFVYVALAPCLFASLFAGALFALVLGPEMQPSAEPFRILILSAVTGLTFTLVGITFQVMDRPDIVERQTLLMAVIFAACYGVAAFDTRFESIAVATLVGNLAALAICIGACFRFFEIAAAAPLWRLARSAGAAALPALTVLALDSAFTPGAITGFETGDLALIILAFLMIYVGLGSWLFKVHPRDILRYARGIK